MPVLHNLACGVGQQGCSRASAAGVLISPMHRAPRTQDPAGSDLRDKTGTSLTLRDWCGGAAVALVLLALQALQQLLEAL